MCQKGISNNAVVVGLVVDEGDLWSRGGEFQSHNHILVAIAFVAIVAVALAVVAIAVVAIAVVAVVVVDLSSMAIIKILSLTRVPVHFHQKLI